MDWRAKRTLDNHQARHGWEHHLLDDVRWQHNLHKHFSGIFHKAPMERSWARLQATRIALTRACKQCPWKPFSRQELEMAATTWKRGKSTGPDGISLEALQAMMQDESWETRIRYMLPGSQCCCPKPPAPPKRGGTHVPSRFPRPSSNGLLSYYSSEADIRCRTGTFTSGPSF